MKGRFWAPERLGINGGDANHFAKNSYRLRTKAGSTLAGRAEMGDRWRLEQDEAWWSIESGRPGEVGVRLCPWALALNEERRLKREWQGE